MFLPANVQELCALNNGLNSTWKKTEDRRIIKSEDYIRVIAESKAISQRISSPGEIYWPGRFTWGNNHTDLNGNYNQQNSHGNSLCP